MCCSSSLSRSAGGCPGLLAGLAGLGRHQERLAEQQQLHRASSAPAKPRAAAAPPATVDAMLDLPKPDDDTALRPRTPVAAALPRGLALVCADLLHRTSPRGSSSRALLLPVAGTARPATAASCAPPTASPPTGLLLPAAGLPDHGGVRPLPPRSADLLVAGDLFAFVAGVAAHGRT
ncbi:uncharacterized protein [Triticum aestivum]|uniref:uncharacterized protein n=1 Tax=Triticum aestivum TaxID=4565 RepID=UPI001D0194EA|nr:uncharacterized protein LOC123106524 [Triticum aestivum]